jgi:hypothetical protein
MDFQTLYNMAANATRNAERMCSQEGGLGNSMPFQSYAGYPFYTMSTLRYFPAAAPRRP